MWITFQAREGGVRRTSVEQVVQAVMSSREAEPHGAPMQSEREAQSVRPSGGGSNAATRESALRRACCDGSSEMQLLMLQEVGPDRPTDLCIS